MDIQANLQQARLEAQNQINNGLIQGAVLAIAHHGPIIALGNQNVTPEPVPMTEDSRFDIASTGKTFTATCVSFLVHEGKVDPDAPFTDYLPDHPMARENHTITVRDLAMHISGFDNARSYMADNWTEFIDKLYAKRPVRPNRTAFEYACSNFILLGLIAEEVSGMTLEQCAQHYIWNPLNMTQTQWTAPGPGPHEVEHWDPNRPAGQHNDAVCNLCPRPIGSGSCFSTAHDMSNFVSEIAQPKHFPMDVIRLMTTCNYQHDQTRRSFGWDMSLDKMPQHVSLNTVFHSGWTGQTICADPQTGFAAVVLTSRRGDWTQAMQGRQKLLGILAHPC